MEVRGQSLHHGSEDQTQAFRLVWQVPLSAEPFIGFYLRLSSSNLYSLHQTYGTLYFDLLLSGSSCHTYLYYLQACDNAVYSFSLQNLSPCYFSVGEIDREELDNTADWCWWAVCLVSGTSRGSLLCCFNVMPKIAIHILKLKNYFLQLFSPASSLLFPPVDLSLLFLQLFFFLPLSCESSWPLLEVTRRIGPVSKGMWVSPSWEFTYKEAGAPHPSGLFVLLTHGHDKPFSFHGCSRVKPLCFLSCLSSVFSSALVFRALLFSLSHRDAHSMTACYCSLAHYLVLL